MKNFTNYIKDEMTKALNENTSQVGLTDVFSGTDVMGPHHHEYWIYDETGTGVTSDAISEPANLNKETPIYKVGGHVHFIRNGICMPVGDGHTHILQQPSKIAPDTKIGSCFGCECNNIETPIRGI